MNTDWQAEYQTKYRELSSANETLGRGLAHHLAKAWPTATLTPPVNVDEEGAGLEYRQGFRVEIEELGVRLWSWGAGDGHRKGDAGRVTIHASFLGNELGIYGQRPKAITVSTVKSSAQIAGDVTRRLMPAAIEWAAKVREIHAEQSARDGRIDAMLTRLYELWPEARLRESAHNPRGRGESAVLWADGFGESIDKVELHGDGTASLSRLRVTADELEHVLSALDRGRGRREANAN